MKTFDSIDNQLNIKQKGGADCDTDLINEINTLLSENERIMNELIKKLDKTDNSGELSKLRDDLEKCTTCKDNYNRALQDIKSKLVTFKNNNESKLNPV